MYVDSGRWNKRIIGCSYRALFNLDQYAYILIKGTNKKPTGFSSTVNSALLRRRRNAINEDLQIYNFKDYVVTSYDEVSDDVRCGIFDPDRMLAPVLSNATAYNTGGKMEFCFFYL